MAKRAKVTRLHICRYNGREGKILRTGLPTAIIGQILQATKVTPGECVLSLAVSFLATVLLKDGNVMGNSFGPIGARALSDLPQPNNFLVVLLATPHLRHC